MIQEYVCSMLACIKFAQFLAHSERGDVTISGTGGSGVFSSSFVLPSRRDRHSSIRDFQNSTRICWAPSTKVLLRRLKPHQRSSCGIELRTR